MKNPVMQKSLPWGSDKWHKPDYFHPDDEEFKSDRPSTSSSTRSRSDRRPAKFKQNKTDIQQKSKTRHKEAKGTRASSSRLTPEERARSLLLPTSDETEGVPRERSHSQDQGDAGQGDTSSVPSTIEYPENNSADLVILDDSSLCILSDISKLASNTSSFSFVVNVDGIADFSEEETSPFAYSVLASMTDEEPQEISLMFMTRSCRHP